MTYLLLKYVPLMQHNDILTSAGVISTVSGILFGFVLATISIFSAASANSNGVLKALKNNNILQGIVTNLLAAGATLITACLISLIAMFASEQLIYNDKKNRVHIHHSIIITIDSSNYNVWVYLA